jgi:hypothetical protein
LELLQSFYFVLSVTRGWGAPETVAAAERAGMLAEKRGNLGQLIGSMLRRCGLAFIAGEMRMAGTLADQTLELAQRERAKLAHWAFGQYFTSPAMLAHAHYQQVMIRYFCGDLAGAEKYLAAGLNSLMSLSSDETLLRTALRFLLKEPIAHF